VVAGGVGYWLWSRAQQTSAAETPTWVVRRGPLRVTVNEGGSLQALRSATVASEVEGETKIVDVIGEGTTITDEDVAKGKIIVELDRTNLDEKRRSQVITISQAEAALAQASQALKIQVNQNESDLRKASLDVQFARIDLRKYVGDDLATRLEARGDQVASLDLKALSADRELRGEALQERSKRESEISLAKEEVARAKDKLKWTDELLAKGYVSKDEQVADALALKRREAELSQAEAALEIFETYEFGKQVQQFASTLHESKEAEGRVKRKADSAVASAEADERGKQEKLSLERLELARIDRQIAACTIRAKSPGLVVYASSEDRGNYMGDEKPIQPGASIRQRQAILSIPDPRALGVRVNVHESALDRVKRDQTAVITVDAFPDRPLAGHVEKMATLPNSANRWQNPDLKLYPTDVAIDDPPATLRPGMSAKVEILVKEIGSTVYVPAQAVAIAAGKPSVWVRTSDGDASRAVRLGLANDRYTEVLEGLTEGEVVLLAPPKDAHAEPAASGERAPDGKPAGRGGRGGRKRGGDAAGMAGESLEKPEKGEKPERPALEGPAMEGAPTPPAAAPTTGGAPGSAPTVPGATPKERPPARGS
jgi:HlyD family secretion protein